jgi:hypothetical protein
MCVCFVECYMRGRYSNEDVRCRQKAGVLNRYISFSIALVTLWTKPPVFILSVSRGTRIVSTPFITLILTEKERITASFFL